MARQDGGPADGRRKSGKGAKAGKSGKAGAERAARSPGEAAADPCATEATSDSRVVSLPRDGAPPLRIRAALAHRTPAAGEAPEVTLWAREPVGWAVALAGPDLVAAAAFDSLEDAAGWLEAQAARAAAPTPTDARGDAAFAARFVARRLAYARAQAVTLALEGWPAVAEAAAD